MATQSDVKTPEQARKWQRAIAPSLLAGSFIASILSLFYPLAGLLVVAAAIIAPFVAKRQTIRSLKTVAWISFGMCLGMLALLTLATVSAYLTVS